jgi:hypothetical protein
VERARYEFEEDDARLRQRGPRAYPDPAAVGVAGTQVASGTPPLDRQVPPPLPGIHDPPNQTASNPSASNCVACRSRLGTPCVAHVP